MNVVEELKRKLENADSDEIRVLEQTEEPVYWFCFWLNIRSLLRTAIGGSICVIAAICRGVNCLPLNRRPKNNYDC